MKLLEAVNGDGEDLTRRLKNIAVLLLDSIDLLLNLLFLLRQWLNINRVFAVINIQVIVVLLINEEAIEVGEVA